jgi:ATP-dependent RNA helicase SUPV3L1/SUV3
LVKKNASDQRYLKILLNDKFIKNNIKNSYELKILWELCRTPDYSRELDEFHCRFLKKVFIFLVSKQKLIPADWIDKELNKIRKKTKKISELNYKISQIRKWSFLAFKSNWMEDTEKFRNKIKSIELDLSLILHSQLINEFVGEFTNKKQILDLKSPDSPIVKIDEKKFIKFGKEKIGELKGLVFNISPSFSKNNIYNNKILKTFLICSAENVFASFFQSDFKEFNFKISGEILWQKNIIAKLYKSSDIFNPKIKIICDEFFLIYREKIESKLFNCFRFFLSKNLSFISKINALKNPSQSMRAVTYSLIENLGHCKKDEIKGFYDVLLPDEISNLKKAGFRSGVFFAFFSDKKARLFRQILINVFFGSQLNNFLDKEVYNLDRLINSKKIGIYKKMGFYMIKVNKKYYLVHFDYLENLYRKNFYLKKKFGSYKPRNKLEKNILENTKIRFIEDSNI